jgi:hypothetical protein
MTLERMPGRVELHEWLVDSYGRISDSFACLTRWRSLAMP